MRSILFPCVIVLASACTPDWGDGETEDTDVTVHTDTPEPDQGEAIYYVDADGDSHGNAATAAIYDEGYNPVGTVLLGDDCDDLNPTIWYGCNDAPPVEYVTACLDADADGYASAICLSFPEGQIPSGWLPVAATDCDDSDRSRTVDCDDPIVVIPEDEGDIGDNEARVQVGDPSVLLVGDNLADLLRDNRVATAQGGFFIIPAVITPGRMNPDQELGLYGYGLGGQFDWQVSLVDLVPAVDRYGTLLGFGQGLPEGIYRVNCGAPMADLVDGLLNSWCNLGSLEQSAAWTIDFMECGLPKQSLCLRVDGGYVQTSEADCLGLYVSPPECEQGGGGVIPDPDYSTWYRDADGDGYGGTQTQSATAQPAGYVSQGGDCDDTQVSTHPGATELPADGRDNNCNLLSDEGGAATVTCYTDADGDGHGAMTGAIQSQGSCPAGRVQTHDDCNDTYNADYPGATENTTDGRDNDCDGVIDEAAAGGGGGGGAPQNMTLEVNGYGSSSPLWGRYLVGTASSPTGLAQYSAAFQRGATVRVTVDATVNGQRDGGALELAFESGYNLIASTSQFAVGQTVEVCVYGSTSDYRLGIMRSSGGSEAHWVTESAQTAQVNSPVVTGSSGQDRCGSWTID